VGHGQGICARRDGSALFFNAVAADPPRTREIEERKDDLMRQLAICESGGHGDSERPIYGGGGTYAGRFQFTIRAVISYVREMDGRVLSSSDALLLAQDYRQAAALAKYMIFVRGDLWNWPACSHKLGLANRRYQDQAMTSPPAASQLDNTLVKPLAVPPARARRGRNVRFPGWCAALLGITHSSRERTGRRALLRRTCSHSIGSVSFCLRTASNPLRRSWYGRQSDGMLRSHAREVRSSQPE
jgi:hypothetical protein